MIKCMFNYMLKKKKENESEEMIIETKIKEFILDNNISFEKITILDKKIKRQQLREMVMRSKQKCILLYTKHYIYFIMDYRILKMHKYIGKINTLVLNKIYEKNMECGICYEHLNLCVNGILNYIQNIFICVNCGFHICINCIKKLMDHNIILKCCICSHRSFVRMYLYRTKNSVE